MILHIPNLLNMDELNHCRQTLSQAEWIDGKVTTGYQSAHLKNNLQLSQDSQEALELGQIIQHAANSNPLFLVLLFQKHFYHHYLIVTNMVATLACMLTMLSVDTLNLINT